jgi:malonyl-CoA decarboxylase
MASDLDIDAMAVSTWASEYARSGSIEDYKRVLQAAEPRRQELLRRLNQQTGATQDLVQMRVDLLRLGRGNPDLARADLDFVHLLRTWFNRGFLVLKQIDWDAPASLLDKIVAYEAVHEIDDLDDLRRRLSPPDRRCFAFFHPAMPDEPLIFVEVALTQDVPNSIDALLTEDREPLFPEGAKTAVFYSISNCQQGLQGISFGNLLIKQVVKELASEFTNLTKFVTLSPIPRLRQWLSNLADPSIFADAAKAMLEGNASPEIERALTARYLVEAKDSKGNPIDPVARFHLGNGAEIYEIHADADNTENGQAQSCGTMVNYLYDLSHVERNHKAFALNAIVATSKSVQNSAKMSLIQKPEKAAS